MSHWSVPPKAAVVAARPVCTHCHGKGYIQFICRKFEPAVASTIIVSREIAECLSCQATGYF